MRGHGEPDDQQPGDKLHLVLLCGADPHDDAAREIVIGGLRKAGFFVEVRAGDAAAVLSRLKTGDFDAALLEVRGEADEDLAPMWVTGGNMNWGGFSSREVDAVLARLRDAWEPAQRRARMAELAQLLDDLAPEVALVAMEPHGLAAKRVKGIVVRDGWFSLRDLSLEWRLGYRVVCGRSVHRARRAQACGSSAFVDDVAAAGRRRRRRRARRGRR